MVVWLTIPKGKCVNQGHAANSQDGCIVKRRRRHGSLLGRGHDRGRQQNMQNICSMSIAVKLSETQTCPWAQMLIQTDIVFGSMPCHLASDPDLLVRVFFEPQVHTLSLRQCVQVQVWPWSRPFSGK
jgi:hypothetical protein